MLIFGKSVSDWQEKGKYAQNKADNEFAMVHEVRCEGIDHVPTAMETMAAFAADSKCKKFLYHATINLNPGERLTHEQWMKAVDMLEKNLNLTGHYRVVFEHIKKDRQHYHILWSRIPPKDGPAVTMGNDFYVHQNTAKTLEQEFGLVHAPRRDKSKPSKRKQEINDRNSSVRVKPEIVTKEVTTIFQNTKTGDEFVKNLAKAGYALTRAKNDSYVLVDKQGGYHGLMRRIQGAKLGDLITKFPDLAKRPLPTLSEVLKSRRPASIHSFKNTARIVSRARIAPIQRSYAGYRPLFYIPPRPSLLALLAAIRRRTEKKEDKPGSEFIPYWKRRRRRKKDENIPASELPILSLTPEEAAMELLIWAWEQKRPDILAANFNINLPSDFEF